MPTTDQNRHHLPFDDNRGFSWSSDAERAAEFAAAEKYLRANTSNPTPEETTITPNHRLTYEYPKGNRKPLKHKFVIIEGTVYAKATAHFANGSFGHVTLGMDKSGELITIKDISLQSLSPSTYFKRFTRELTSLIGKEYSDIIREHALNEINQQILNGNYHCSELYSKAFQNILLQAYPDKNPSDAEENMGQMFFRQCENNINARIDEEAIEESENVKNAGEHLASQINKEKHQHAIITRYRGRCLRNHLEHNPHLNDVQRIDLALKVVDAVSKLHKRGYAHLDLKPDNITIDQKGDVHLIDFGMIKKLDEQKHDVYFGTPAYMPNKQNCKNIAYKDADCFALMRTLFFAHEPAVRMQARNPSVLNMRILENMPVLNDIFAKSGLFDECYNRNTVFKCIHPSLELLKVSLIYARYDLELDPRQLTETTLKEVIKAHEKNNFPRNEEQFDQNSRQLKRIHRRDPQFIQSQLKELLEKIVYLRTKDGKDPEKDLKIKVCNKMIRALKDYPKLSPTSLQTLLKQAARVLSHKEWSVIKRKSPFGHRFGLADSYRNHEIKFKSLATRLNINSDTWEKVLRDSPENKAKISSNPDKSSIVTRNMTYSFFNNKKTQEEALESISAACNEAPTSQKQ